MTLHERVIGDVTILDIDGRITVQDGGDMFRDAVRRLVREGCLKLVLNFHETAYIDSTALGEIVRTYTSITRRGGRLRLLHVTARVEQLLAITQIRSVFDVFDDEAEVVKSFGTPSIE